MNRPAVWRALVALLVVGLTGFFAVTKDPKLGLDLRGGTQIVLETRDSPTTQADAEATDRALEVLRRRVDALGVAEPTLARSGANRIIVELPGVDDPAAAEEAVGRTAQLTFHPVLGPGDPSALPPEQQEQLAEQPDLPIPSPSVEEVPVEEGTEGTESPAPTPSPTAAPLVDAPAMEPVAFTQATSPSPSPSPTGSPESAEELEGEQAEEDDTGLRDPVQFDPTQEQSLLSDQGDVISVGPAALTGEGVGDAAVVTDQTTGVGRYVSIDFRGDGGREWERITAEAACQPAGDPRRRIAIVLDGAVISSPQVETSVQCGVGIQGGSTQITGNFTQEEAQNLAVLIKGGALPVPVETISRSFVGPTLGEDAIDASWKAGIIGVALTGLFLVVVYRLAGFLAALALASYGVISYGTLVALGATLTLPGLGGLLLSAGLAIDANVLVYERTREEFAARKSGRLIAALDSGFSKALSAIADSNVTTLLAAALLFFLAAGPVRGFGVTLTIGVLASMVSALLVTRVLAEFAVKRGIVFRRPRISGFGTLGRFREFLERRQPDLMGKSRLWVTISAVALLVAIAGPLVRGFNFGVEFTGGRVVE
ncbi:MAG TPA: protein translocase subunit SecD, partial [Mycobacteriales bacterium]|nr:protein translocase subunit SecD [Mycobacteriales bacterium]